MHTACIWAVGHLFEIITSIWLGILSLIFTRNGKIKNAAFIFTMVKPITNRASTARIIAHSPAVWTTGNDAIPAIRTTTMVHLTLKWPSAFIIPISNNISPKWRRDIETYMSQCSNAVLGLLTALRLKPVWFGCWSHWFRTCCYRWLWMEAEWGGSLALMRG